MIITVTKTIYVREKSFTTSASCEFTESDSRDSSFIPRYIEMREAAKALNEALKHQPKE